jgi:spore coat polysaccharide biosynthesis protein SpsF
MKFQTPQEEFWAGTFGDEYIHRNQNDTIISANIASFSKIFSRIAPVESVLEFGSNIGLNLRAIKQLLPTAELSAIEINKKAVSILKKWGQVNVYHKSILEFECDYPREFVFTKGLLIHMNPGVLPQVYEKLYESSRKYIYMLNIIIQPPWKLPTAVMRQDCSSVILREISWSDSQIFHWLIMDLSTVGIHVISMTTFHGSCWKKQDANKDE